MTDSVGLGGYVLLAKEILQQHGVVFDTFAEGKENLEEGDVLLEIPCAWEIIPGRLGRTALQALFSEDER